MTNQMPFELMIECPKTGKLVPIGKTVALNELRNYSFVMEHIIIQCPHCSGQHIASEEKASIRLH